MRFLIAPILSFPARFAPLQLEQLAVCVCVCINTHIRVQHNCISCMCAITIIRNTTNQNNRIDMGFNFRHFQKQAIRYTICDVTCCGLTIRITDEINQTYDINECERTYILVCNGV